MSDRDLLLYIAKLLGALVERLTGERLVVDVETDKGTLYITTGGGVPQLLREGAEGLVVDQVEARAKYL